MTDTIFPLEPTAADAQAAIKDEFAFFGDWSERYQYLIDLGRKLPPFPEEWKREEHRLLGCQSMVWIVPVGDAARLDFHAISESAWSGWPRSCRSSAWRPSPVIWSTICHDGVSAWSPAVRWRPRR